MTKDKSGSAEKWTWQTDGCMIEFTKGLVRFALMAALIATQIQDSALWKQPFALMEESFAGLEERFSPVEERFAGVEERSVALEEAYARSKG